MMASLRRVFKKVTKELLYRAGHAKSLADQAGMFAARWTTQQLAAASAFLYHISSAFGNACIQTVNYVLSLRKRAQTFLSPWLTPRRVWVFVVFLTLTLLPTIITYFQFIQPALESQQPMRGEFNIAVAGFQVTENSNITARDIDHLAEVFSQRLSSDIQTLARDIDIVMEVRKPSGTGVIQGTTQYDRALKADDIAKRINADVIVYGTLVNTAGKNYLLPEFYVRADQFHGAEEVVGQYALGTGIDVTGFTTNPSVTIAANRDLAARSQALSLIVLGLSFYARQDYKAASQLFESAATREDWHAEDGKEVVYVLLGNAYGQLSQLDSAEDAYTSAAALNPTYSRVYLGLGTVNYLRAIGNPSEPSYDTVNSELLDKASSYFSLALMSEDRPSGANIEAKAHFGLGQVKLLRAFSTGSLDFVDAKTEFETVLSIYDGGGNAEVGELAAHSHAHLGLIALAMGDQPGALHEYSVARDLTNSKERQAFYASRLGEIRFNAGDIAGALEEYKYALNTVPKELPDYEKYQQRIEELQSQLLQP